MASTCGGIRFAEGSHVSTGSGLGDEDSRSALTQPELEATAWQAPFSRIEEPNLAEFYQNTAAGAQPRPEFRSHLSQRLPCFLGF